MVQRDHRGRIALPLNAAQAAEAKQIHNKSAVVPILDSDASVAVKTDGTLIYRPRTNVLTRASVKASAMKKCAGKRGCEFASCLEAGGITPPSSVLKACGRAPTAAQIAGAGAALRAYR
jgi:hypothetical protein